MCKDSIRILQRNRTFVCVCVYIYIHTHTAEKATAPHSSTLAWKIPWMEEPNGYSPWGHKELDTTEWLHFYFSLSCTGEGNGNPFQCSCLENPRDGGVWWAVAYGVAQSRTRLKRLSSSSSIHIHICVCTCVYILKQNKRKRP